ncbi:MAG: hypothetical protein IJV50_11430 [Lachnospiraceae bacterium]|nr:hypothetical protein [Lachnospiraceae bacterium]
MKYSEFLHIAGIINEELLVIPLLFGSLGLERRLKRSLNADDIDVLISERFLKTDWDKLKHLMENEGYLLVDEEEHEFRKDDICIAFADIEGLMPFAGIDISRIPEVADHGVRYLLLELPDYLKVYEASLKDSYRKDVKNKQDQSKIDLIKEEIM